MCFVGTSPLYTFPNVFSSEPTPLDVLGAVSIIFWTITLITIVKYILIVMNFNDEGEGNASFSFTDSQYITTIPLRPFNTSVNAWLLCQYCILCGLVITLHNIS